MGCAIPAIIDVALISLQIEDYDGFRIKSLLSVPITNGKKKVIGVVQMMNKANGKPFTESDISTVEVGLTLLSLSEVLNMMLVGRLGGEEKTGQ